jgi:hypothetical protein
MLNVDCPECQARVPPFASACPHCGAPNPARNGALAIAAALTLLTGVLIFSGVALLSSSQPSPTAVSPPTELVVQPDAASAAEEFAWLSKAMKDCDDEAARDVGALHFLVAPLTVASAADQPSWRAKAINPVGNAILLSADDTLDGLRRRALRVAPTEYTFGMRDVSTSAVYTWKASKGVAKFSTPDAQAIESFNVQFQTGGSATDAEWGSAFVRQSGACYWVNAILGN